MIAVMTTAALLGATSEDWLPMPDGRLYHRTCIHAHDLPKHVDLAALGPCPQPRREAARGQVESGYYSDWVAYAQIESSNGFRHVASAFTVPKPPRS